MIQFLHVKSVLVESFILIIVYSVLNISFLAEQIFYIYTFYDYVLSYRIIYE